jgi:hypothetical protein
MVADKRPAIAGLFSLEIFHFKMVKLHFAIEASLTL